MFTAGLIFAKLVPREDSNISRYRKALTGQASVEDPELQRYAGFLDDREGPFATEKMVSLVIDFAYGEGL